LLGDELAGFDSDLDVVEGAVSVLDFLVEFGELPREGLVFLEGDVERPQLLEGVA